MADGITLVNGIILTDPGSSDVQPHGKTMISGERLADVNVSVDSPGQGDVVIDCAHCLIMPGLINGHTHGAMSLLRGLADDVPLDQWLNQYIFPAEAKYVGPEFVYLGTMISAVEMALGGVTTFADGYFFMESAARAALDVGLRAVIAQGVLDVPAPDAPSPGSWKQRAEDFLASCPTDSLISPALFCHSPYLCGPQTFQDAAELARSHGTLLFSHVSETAGEVEEVRKRYGKRPVEHLRDLDVLGESFVAVHAVHVDDTEMDFLAESGTSVVHCPESNMKLAAGACQSWELLRRGITLGIGTDGAASNNNLDLFEEMRTASLVAKLMTKDPESLGASAAVKMATQDGARALGMDDEIGTLTRGKLADVVVIDLDRPHLTPVYDPVSHLVYAARGSDVRDVIVNGRLVVRHGRMVTVDERELKARARAMASTIGRELGATYGGAYTADV